MHATLKIAKPPKPPAHLTKLTRAWWVAIAEQFQLEPHHELLLTAAAESLDRYQQAREILAREGLVVSGREAGTRPHPCVQIERDSRASFVRIMGQLGLDAVGEPRPVGRPPAVNEWRGCKP